MAYTKPKNTKVEVKGAYMFQRGKGFETQVYTQEEGREGKS